MNLRSPIRSALFALLAQAFAPPDIGRRAREQGDKEKGEKEKSPCHPLTLSPPLLWRPASETLRSGLAEGTVRLREYQRLFVGLPRPAVYPYESCYREPDGQLAGPWMAQVAALYANEGLTSDGLLPDHIVAELAFMAHLAARQAEAETQRAEASAQGYREQQVAFLRDHLSRWAPAFCQAVLAHADDLFYGTAARLLQDLLRAEVEQGSRGAGAPGGTGDTKTWWSLDIDPDRCILCGVCADVCPPAALKLERCSSTAVQGCAGMEENPPQLPGLPVPARWALVLHWERCTGCDACRRICPTRAICSLKPAAEQRPSRVLAESPVVACRGCGTPLMPQANLTYLEHRLRQQGANLMAQLTLCPTCRFSGISG